MSEELKPCPFCGGIPSQEGTENSDYVYCTQCCATTDVVKANSGDDERAWNTRTPDHTALINKLVGALSDIKNLSKWGGTSTREGDVNYIAEEALAEAKAQGFV